MAKKYNGRIKDYIFQAVLIIFSVLFALFINRYTENMKIKKQEYIAWSSIQQELSRNHEILMDWRQRHVEAYNRINELLQFPDDSLVHILFSTESFNFGEMTNDKNLMDDIMTDTSWQTALSTGIISEFDYTDIENLTKIYALQDNIINNTLRQLINLFHERDTQHVENMRSTLVLFRSHFNELVGQEYILLQLYGQLSDTVE